MGKLLNVQQDLLKKLESTVETNTYELQIAMSVTGTPGEKANV
jgi:hypothetical protein